MYRRGQDEAMHQWVGNVSRDFLDWPCSHIVFRLEKRGTICMTKECRSCIVSNKGKRMEKEKKNALRWATLYKWTNILSQR